MNRFYRLTLKASLAFFEFCCIIIALSGAAIATEPPGYTPEEVLAYVNETYQKVQSAEGVILRTKGVGNEEQQRFTGRFAVKKPDLLFVEYVRDLRQLTAYDGKTFRIYFPDENRGLYRETQNLSEMERYILGPGPFFGNILPVMEKEYSFSVIDMFEGKLILRAIPRNSDVINYILIGIDPEVWIICAVELFYAQNNLVKQTRYLEFLSYGDSLFFPITVKTLSTTNSRVTEETTLLSNVQINVSPSESYFQIPGNDNTEWIARPDEE